MNQLDMLPQHILDSAHWQALYRSLEMEHPAPLFQDPLAAAFSRESDRRSTELRAQAWSVIVRTRVVDELVLQAIHEGADMVITLNAGFDTRPYRLEISPDITWTEIDLPAIIDYKERVLEAKRATCKIERIRSEMQTDARKMLFEELSRRGRNILLISEWRLIYLRPADVASMADELSVHPEFRHWVLDLASPVLVHLLKEHQQSGAAALQFAPANGVGFFAEHGWDAVKVDSIRQAASRLHRLPPELQVFENIPEDPATQPWSGVCLLRNRSQLK